MAIGGVREAGADVAALKEAVEACFNTPLSCLSAQELSDRTVALTAVAGQLDALRVETLRAADLADVGRLNDQRNAANHAASRTHNDPAEFRAQALLGKWLNDFDVLAEAHRTGELSSAHLHVLRRAHNPRVHHQMQADQSKFVRWLRSCQFRDIGDIVDRWLLGADPDGAEPKAHEPSVGFTLTKIGGGLWKIRGVLDPLQGSALNDAIEEEAKKLRAAEQEAGSIWTRRLRTVHALLNLVGRGAARPDGTFAKPRVNIVMSQKVQEATIAWLADPARNPFPEIDGIHIDKKCQLIDGTPIHPLYALAATITGELRRIVYSARGRPIDASFNSRRIPDWMRDITLIATNGKCANPVCDSPFHWLQGDHIIPYSHTQDTSVHNTRPLCGCDNVWCSNDTSRGTWAVNDEDIDWDTDEDDEEPDLIEIAEMNTRIRERIETLAATSTRRQHPQPDRQPVTNR